jgi:hypothetical protein
MKKLIFLWMIFCGILLGTVMPARAAEQIESVMAINDLTLEIVMSRPLSAEELDPGSFADGGAPFTFNEDIHMTGPPIPQEENRTYRIPVSGLQENIIYTISYRGEKPLTFKAYTQKEMDQRYKARYGDYF